MATSGLAGHAQRPSVWSVQAPPPPPAPPPVVPPSGGYSAPPPPRRGGFPWLWVLLGCGCLMLILVAGGIVGGLWYFGHRVEGEVRQLEGERTTPAPAPSADDDAGNTSSAEEPTTTTRPETKPDTHGGDTPAAEAPQPSKEKAVAKALSRCDPGWVTKIVKHSDDWVTVTIAVGPPASEWVGEFDLKWNGSDYDIIAEHGE